MVKDPEPRKFLHDLLKGAHFGEFVVPYFQRDFEWTPGMVKDLLVSIVQDYFTGLLLFWELDPGAIKSEKWDALEGTEPAKDPSLAVLDGQQRLVSLHYAIHGPDIKFPTRESYYSFYLDLGKYLNGDYDESISYGYASSYVPLDKIKSDRDQWIEKGVVPLRILSDRAYVDSSEFMEWMVGYAKKLAKDSQDADEYKLLFGVRDAVYKILNHQFLTHTLTKDRQLDDICGIFAATNQKGMKLSTFDLMNAFLYPKGIELKKEWGKLDNDKLKQTDTSANEYLLKLISLYKQDYCSSKYIFYLIPGKKIKKKEDDKITETVLVKTQDEFTELWNNACKYAGIALERIMNVGQNDFGAVKTDYIPNTTIIPVMGAVMLSYEKKYKSSVPEDTFNKMLTKWYWSAVISKDYSGSSDSVMSEDYRAIAEWFKTMNTAAVPRIAKVSDEFINSLNLKEYKKGSTIYNGFLCSIALNKAEDFYTTRTLDTGSFKEGNINDHHIFPTKAEGYAPEKTKQFSATHDIILNRTLLLDSTNQSILNSRPSVYLKTVRDKLDGDETKLKALMEKHLISSKALDCMNNDDYDGFIEERETTMKEKLLDLRK